MGVVNVTPDSFSDGGDHAGADAAITHGQQLIAEGADILDIGGESTRPGATPVSVEEEVARVIPVIEGLSGTGPKAGGPMYMDRFCQPALAERHEEDGAAAQTGVHSSRRPHQ